MVNKQKAWRMGAAAINAERKATGKGLSARQLKNIRMAQPTLKGSNWLLGGLLGGYISAEPVHDGRNYIQRYEPVHKGKSWINRLFTKAKGLFS